MLCGGLVGWWCGVSWFGVLNLSVWFVLISVLWMCWFMFFILMCMYLWVVMLLCVGSVFDRIFR